MIKTIKTSNVNMLKCYFFTSTRFVVQFHQQDESMAFARLVFQVHLLLDLQLKPDNQFDHFLVSECLLASKDR